MSEFLCEGGELGHLIRKYDWETTPIGSPDTWPQSLRTTLQILLNSKFPMLLWWGDELIQFYNDAYRPSLGNNGKHPKAIGQKGKECWAEIWPVIQPLIDQVMSGGGSTWAEDQLIPIYRNGHIEDVYWTFSYSPVFNEIGKVAGILVVCYETTEKIQNSIKLKERDDQLHFAIEATELGIWDFDPLNNTFTGNDRLKEWFGLPANEILELPMAISVIAPHDRERILDSISQALTYGSGGDYDMEYVIINPKTREERVVRAKGRAWFNDDNIAYRFNGTLQDITTQAKARTEIEAGEERFRTFANNIQNLAWIANGEGWIYWYNQRWYDYTGSNEEKMLGWGWQEVHHPDHIGRILEFVKKAWVTPEPFELIFPLRRHDGEFRWFLTRAYPIIDAHGMIERWIGTNTDITEQKLAEDRFRSLAETLPNLVWMAKPNGDYEFASKRWIEYTGLDPMDSDTWVKIVHPDDLTELMTKWNHSVNTGDRYYAELRLKNRNDEFRWHLASGETIRNDDGTIIRWIGTLTDIHDQKSFTEELELQVLERTKELARSNEDLLQFAHVASHDLKEPVRKIKVFAGQLHRTASEKLSADENFSLSRVLQATDRMFDMINGVLAYSTFGTFEQIIETVDLRRTITQVENDLELLLKDKNAQIRCDDLATIEGVPVLLHQLFYNLFNNSLKFSKKDIPLVINVKSELIEISAAGIPSKKHLHIEVSDNGIGFDSKYSEKIFRTFARLNTKDKFEGTGLGLSLCRKIVERHNGTITASGVEGEGAVFTVILPLKATN